MSICQKTIICTVCPVGCQIQVSGNDDLVTSIEEYGCQRGKTYAFNEFLHPVRIFTSSVRLSGGKEPLIAVRTDKPIPKKKLFDCVQALRDVVAVTPVHCGDIIVHDILGTGANIIATGESL